jgi:protein-L-isoaspartate(D-aspartate) O-methyltransferase
MDVEAARRQMVDQQVRTWEVLDDRALVTLESVKREHFVPDAYRDLAFADAEIPLGHGEVMLAPKIEGRILQALQVQPNDSVLDVGTGSGFLAACFGRLAARVRSLDIYPDLVERAQANLLRAASNNVVAEHADACQLSEENRYDAIAVTGSLAVYDERFQRALKIGGRLFVVVGQAPIMEAWKVTRTGEREWVRTSLFETVMRPLLNAPRPSAFVF